MVSLLVTASGVARVFKEAGVLIYLFGPHPHSAIQLPTRLFLRLIGIGKVGICLEGSGRASNRNLWDLLCVILEA